MASLWSQSRAALIQAESGRNHGQAAMRAAQNKLGASPNLFHCKKVAVVVVERNNGSQPIQSLGLAKNPFAIIAFFDCFKLRVAVPVSFVATTTIALVVAVVSVLELKLGFNFSSCWLL